MSKRFYLFLSFIFLMSLNPLEIKGHNITVIDSLKNLNTTEEDQKQKVDNYLSIAEEFTHGKVDSTFFYINKALKLGKKIAYKEGQAQAYYMLSYYLDVRGEFTKSIESLEQAIVFFEELGDSSYLSASYNNLGALYSYGSEQKKSLEYFIKSINIGVEAQDSFSLAPAYSNVAEFYYELKEYNSALKYFKKALEIDLHYNIPEDVAISYLDVGHVNTNLRRYDDALVNLNEAQNLLSEINDDFYKIILYQRFGNYYQETGELNLAESYILKAQRLLSAYNYPMLDAETLSIKGEILLKQKKFKNSLAVLDSSIEKYNEINSQGTFNELYNDKADAYFGLKLHNKAYEFLQLANKEEELLESNVIAEYLSEFERSEALKEERARFQLVQELENQRNENVLIKVRSRLYFTIYIALFLGAVLVVALYLFVLKQNHNKSLESSHELIIHQKHLIQESYSHLKENEKRLAALNATKDKFFSIIAHDLKNPFNTLIGISELMISNPEIKDTEDFEELMQGMFETAKSGHNLLENLLEWSRSQVGSIQLEPKLISLNDVFKAAFTFFQETAKAKGITISIAEVNAGVVYADYNMVNFIIRNLINNAIKFSYGGSKIEVESRVDNKKTVISIIDNGVGINAETIDKLFKIEHSIQKNGTANEKGTGLGLVLCKEFVENNGGEIWVESKEGKGSKFSFSLPNSAI